MSKYELLCPAGSLETVEPMIEAGADAIYVGLSGFSSRPQKSDMTVEQIKQSILICHEKNVKLYVAINVAVSQKTFQNVVSSVLELDQAGADAVIIADMGLLYFLSGKLKNSALHASTLLGVYNIETVRILRQIGVTRIIFYANLYFDEMAAICNAVPDIEYELVAEGGTCFNDIRQCLLPHTYKNNEHCLACRFTYQLNCNDASQKAKPICEYANKVAEVLGIYMGIGITSFKIEGRTSPWQERVVVAKRLRKYIDEFEAFGKPRAFLHYFSRANREMN